MPYHITSYPRMVSHLHKTLIHPHTQNKKHFYHIHSSSNDAYTCPNTQLSSNIGHPYTHRDTLRHTPTSFYFITEQVIDQESISVSTVWAHMFAIGVK